MLLGGMLIAYGGFGLFVKQLPDLSRHAGWLSPIVGYIGGALIVSTGVIIIPAVPYLQSLRLKRDELVQSLGLVFTFSTICLAIYLYLYTGASSVVDYRLAWLAVLPALLGMWWGQKSATKLPKKNSVDCFCGADAAGAVYAGFAFNIIAAWELRADASIKIGKVTIHR